jgi:ABC-type multidrug transport system permease subunit
MIAASLRRARFMFGQEVLALRREPRLLVALFGLPLILTLLADLAFSWPGQLPGRLAVQDLDHSMLSSRLDQQLLRSPHSLSLADIASPADLAKANPDLVVAVIPAGLQASVVQGKALPIATTVNRQGQSRAGSALSAVRSAAEETTSLALLVAESRRAAIAAHAQDGGDAAAQVALLNGLKDFGGSRVKVDSRLVGSAPSGSYSRLAQFATGNGVMFMMFVGAALASLLAFDRQEGRLRRLLGTRLRLRELLAAKLAAIVLLSSLCMGMILAIGAIGFQMSLGPSPLLLAAITIAVALAVSGYALLLLGIGRNGIVVQALATVLTLSLSAIGGSWWPQEAEQPWLRTVGHVALNAWASDAYHLLLFDNRTDAALLIPIAVLVGLAILQAMIGAWLFDRRLRTA